MRVIVIGGTGHIGSYLVPMLVEQGDRVAVLSRGERSPYHDDPAWVDVERVVCDRTAEEADGTFAARVAGWSPEVIMDLTCFTTASAEHLMVALDGQHLIHTGSIWAYGRSLVVPVTEDSVKAPYGEYGINKARLEDYLLRGQDTAPATVIHPGHITGPGWVPINPAGNGDPGVYAELVSHGRVVLPDQGMGLLQHVHAADVAGLHLAARNQPDAAAGQAFNSVAEQSLSLRGYAELVAREYGHEPDLTYLTWPEFAARVGEINARVTADHIDRSPHHSTAKGADLLGFHPAHTAWETVGEAIAWLVEHNQLPAAG